MIGTSVTDSILDSLQPGPLPCTGIQLRDLLGSHGMAVVSVKADGGGGQERKDKVIQLLEIKIKGLQESLGDKEYELVEAKLENAVSESQLKEANQKFDYERNRHNKLLFKINNQNHSMDMHFDSGQLPDTSRYTSGTITDQAVPPSPPASYAPTSTPASDVSPNMIPLPGSNRRNKFFENLHQTYRQFNRYVQTNQKHLADNLWTGNGFRCVCSNWYRSKSGLQFHIRKMTQEWRYRCSGRRFGCGQYFFQRSHLLAHLKRCKRSDFIKKTKGHHDNGNS